MFLSEAQRAQSVPRATALLLLFPCLSFIKASEPTDRKFSIFNMMFPFFHHGGGRGRRYVGKADRTSRAKQGAGGKSKSNRCNHGPNCQCDNQSGDIDTVTSVSSSVSNGNSSLDGDVSVGSQHERRREREQRKNEEQMIVRQFQVAEFCPSETLHSNPDHVDVFTQDCLGAPFCGLVAIDTALRKERDIKDYLRRVSGDLNLAPNEVGSFDYLRSYSLERGVNLRIRDTDGVILYLRQHNVHWKWVYLKFIRPDEFVGLHINVAGDECMYGHYVMEYRERTSYKLLPDKSKDRFECPESGLTHWATALPYCFVGVRSIFIGYNAYFNSKLRINWFDAFLGICVGFFSFKVVRRITFTETVTPKNDYDRRNHVDKRDNLETQEAGCYAITSRHVILGNYWTKMLGLRPSFKVPWMFDNVEPRLVEINKYRVIADAMDSMAPGLPREANLASFAALRGVNSLGVSGSALSTLSVLKDYARSVDNHGLVNLRGLVQYNATGAANVMPNIDNMAENQLVGAGCMKSKLPVVNNHVHNGRWRKDKVAHKAVATAPLGPIVTEKGVVSAGAICLTDSDTVLAAFMNRAMSKARPKDMSKVKKCVKVAKRFFSKLISKSTLPILSRPGQVYEANCLALRKMYAGKRPQAWIDMMCKNYVEYCCNRLRGHELKRFTQHSFFVKFESNIKAQDDKLFSRARGIMTMSPLMMLELAQVGEVLHSFYHTRMAEFQIKNLTLQDMADRIVSHSESGCMVTDASAFESSIIPELRKIEEHVVTLLCNKCGLPDVAKAYLKHKVAPRHLRTRWGTLVCVTRCSGDYDTSASNGIMNLSLVVYEYYLAALERQDTEANFSIEKLLVRTFEASHEDVKTDYDNYLVDRLSPKALVEGDDGLVPVGTMNEEHMKELGFKYSSEVVGQRPGDVDFLRSLWHGGKRYLNIGRCLSLLWVKKCALLSRGKQLWLLRMAALSLYHLSPGHPVLTALINRIERETKHVREFKGFIQYVDTWKGTEIYSKSFPRDIEIDETMRTRVAEGAIGFPPISIGNQLHLERVFETEEVFYVGRILDDYDDISQRVNLADNINQSHTYFNRAIEACGLTTTGVQKRSDTGTRSCEMFRADGSTL